MAATRSRSKTGVREVSRAKILRRSSRPGFNPNLFPSCDGRPLAAVPSAEPWLTVKRRFLEAYYQINLRYAELRSRRNGGPRLEPNEERALLQAIDRALQTKEALEDRWASRGLVATPEQLNGLTVNVTFSHPGSPAARPAIMGSSAEVTLSFRVPLQARRRK